MKTMFEYKLGVAREAGGTYVPMTVRGEDYRGAQAALMAALPTYWQRDPKFRIEGLRQLSVDEQRVVELEERNAFLEASFAEAQAEVERLQAIVDSDADELGVLRNAVDRLGAALTVIWQLSDEDTAGAAKDAARPILNGDPTGFVTAPDKKET